MLMSALLDPSSRFHLQRTGLATGWRCLEIGAGHGSASNRSGRPDILATDLHPDLMQGIAGSNLEGGVWHLS
jgi:hypothetical protein